MRFQHQQGGFSLRCERSDRSALGFVLLTIVASTAWLGLYVGLTAKAIGLL